MIVIDTSVWIMIINKVDHPKAEAGRTLINQIEDIGIPGIVLDEILRGFRDDKQFEIMKRYLIEDFDYLEMTREVFIKSAEIYRKLRKNGVTLKNPADCLIASCALENNAAIMENDADFKKIAALVPLELV